MALLLPASAVVDAAGVVLYAALTLFAVVLVSRWGASVLCAADRKTRDGGMEVARVPIPAMPEELKRVIEEMK